MTKEPENIYLDQQDSPANGRMSNKESSFGNAKQAKYDFIRYLFNRLEQSNQSWQCPEDVFWRLGSVFGLLFLVITPPFQSPDENGHYYRSYQVSEGTFWATKFSETSVGGKLPRSLQETFTQIAGEIAFHSDKKQSLNPVMALLSAEHAPLAAEDRTNIEFLQQSLGTPVSYLPQACGMVVGRQLGLSALGLSYVARISNFVVAMFLTYWAIRLMPLMKWSMVLLAMMPMSVFLRSTMSPDALLNSLSFLYIALILRVASSKVPQFTRWSWCLIGVVAILLGQCKPPYFLMTLLICLIPSERAGGRRKYWLIFLTIFSVNAALLAMWLASTKNIQISLPHSPTYIAAQREGRDTSRLAAEQIAYIKANPMQVLVLLWNTFRESALMLLEMLLGQLGWLDVSISLRIRYAFLYAILLAAFFEGDPSRQLSARMRIWMLMVFVLISIALGIAMYIIWTPTGAGIIEGLQGRYFIPVLPLLLLPLTLQSGWIDFQRWKIPLLVSLFLIVGLSLTLRTITFRYYIPPIQM